MARDPNQSAVDKANSEARGTRTTGTVSSEARTAFEKLTPEQRRNVMNWGTPEGIPTPELDNLASPASYGTSLRADWGAMTHDQLKTAAMKDRGLANQLAVNNQFGREMPLTGDTHYALSPSVAEQRGLSQDQFAAAVMNQHRSSALAEEMARLNDLYPGNVSRMQKLAIGQPNNEGWYEAQRFLGVDRPGAVKYQIGLPAEPPYLRGAMDVTARTSPRLSSEGPGNFFAGNDTLYPGGVFNHVGAHEFGHAVNESMSDFARSLPDDSTGARKYFTFLKDLGRQPAKDISGYAEQSRLRQGGAESANLSSREPFAELFSMARSEPGMEYFNNPSAETRSNLMDAISKNRSTGNADNAMKRVDQFNDAEKSLRNEGFSEVGAAAPEMLMQLGLPALTGVLASKTHGNVRAALSGATAGAGIGSFFGPEGTLVGGALGAGAGLARQLL